MKEDEKDIFTEVKLEDIVFPIPPISIWGDIGISNLSKQLNKLIIDSVKKK